MIYERRRILDTLLCVCSSGSEPSTPPPSSLQTFPSDGEPFSINEKKSKPVHRDKDERRKIAIGRHDRTLARSCEPCCLRQIPSFFRSGRAGPLSRRPSSRRRRRRPSLHSPLAAIKELRSPLRTRELMSRLENEGRGGGSLSSLPLSPMPYSRHYDQLGSTFQSTSSEGARSRSSSDYRSPPRYWTSFSITIECASIGGGGECTALQSRRQYGLTV